MTWYVRYFFMVTGAAPAETRVLRTKHCIDATDTYAVGGSDKGKERSEARPHQVYVCAGVTILHLPRCDGTSWGRYTRAWKDVRATHRPLTYPCTST